MLSSICGALKRVVGVLSTPMSLLSHPHACSLQPVLCAWAVLQAHLSGMLPMAASYAACCLDVLTSTYARDSRWCFNKHAAATGLCVAVCSPHRTVFPNQQHQHAITATVAQIVYMHVVLLSTPFNGQYCGERATQTPLRSCVRLQAVELGPLQLSQWGMQKQQASRVALSDSTALHSNWKACKRMVARRRHTFGSKPTK